MDSQDRMRRSMESQKRFNEQAARDRESHRRAYEAARIREEHRRKDEQQRNFADFQRQISTKNRENGYNGKDQSALSKIFGYIFLLVVICFIIWVIYNIISNIFQYGLFG